MKKMLFFSLAILLCGCASKSMVDNYKVVEFKEDNNTIFNNDWYKGYNKNDLNFIVSTALKNNYDLKTAGINLSLALARAGVISADLLPSFSLSFDGNFKRDISKSDEFSENYGGNLSIKYELDLFGKIRDSLSAKEWLAKASKYDLYSTKLSIINSSVDAYFKILYLKDCIKLIDENLKNYNDLLKIQNAKFSLGKAEKLSLDEVRNSLLSLENTKKSYEIELQQSYKLLKQILALTPFDRLNITTNSLFDVKFQGVNLQVPFYALYARPDLKSKIASINSAYFDYKVSYKSFFPSVSIGSSLSSNSNNSDDGFKLNIFGTNIGLSLPFLDFYRLNKNLNVSKLSFEKEAIAYEKALNEALNEVSFYYKNYILDKKMLLNLENSLKNDSEIAKIYYTKYSFGKSELKDYLEAKNREINSKLDLIKQRYKVFSDEIGIYKALGNKF